jgi:5'(3')-deoxyribonucleotidase
MNDRFRSIGVDLDGVLANQVVGVFPRIKANYGVVLRYEDIVQWQLPINGAGLPTDIAKEIAAAQADPEYVLTMPVHHGARQMLEELRRDFRVVVLTARSGEALKWSVKWLELNGLPFDDLAGSAEAKKSLHGVDALVDDYLRNVEEFLTNATGPAVLVDQPWNRIERDALASYVSAKRLAVVTTLTEVPVVLGQLAF